MESTAAAGVAVLSGTTSSGPYWSNSADPQLGHVAYSMNFAWWSWSALVCIEYFSRCRPMAYLVARCMLATWRWFGPLSLAAASGSRRLVPHFLHTRV